MAVARTPVVLTDVLTAQAAARPRATAIRFEGRAITYAQLDHDASRVAAFLAQELGLRTGDRVAWLGANDPALLVLLFALARCGAALVPLNFRLAPAEWDAQLRACAPSLIVHDDAWATSACDLARRHGLPALDREQLAQAPAGDAPPWTVANTPALLVFTSGTTGEPKAAVHTQANLLANMRIASGVQAMSPADRVATMLPLFHVGGLCIQTLPALFAGAEVVLHARFAADAAFDCFKHDRPTLTLQVPATMKALVEHPRWRDADLSSLRAVWAGSSLLPARLVQAFHARGLPVCNVYGATETGPFSIALPPEHAMSHAGTCGWPAPGVDVELRDGQDDAGEVCVRAPNVVATYWPSRPALDREGWFRTGDLATRAGDGSYTIVGRSKELVISGGENIHPAEIEAALAEHPGVLECAAFGVPDAQWGEAVAVAVVPRDAGVATEDLRAFLEGRIARFKLPRRWFLVDALPKTALGKIRRGELQRLAGG